MKKFLTIVLCLALFLGGCSPDSVPMSVTFKNQTPLNAQQTTITVVFCADKRLDEKSVDVLVKSNIDNLECSFAKELGVFQDVVFASSEEWYSLSSVFGSEPVSYKQVQTTTFLIKTTTKNAGLTFVAVAGDLSENSRGLQNTDPISKEVFIKLNETSENA